jgi:galactokinase
MIKKHDSGFDFRNFQVDKIDEYAQLISPEQKELLTGALINRDLTVDAKKMFLADSFDHRMFGQLLNEHQEILDKKLKISTAKINHMLTKAKISGAYGGKINGSGGGGCMFVYAPENTDRVSQAIHDAGGKTYNIKVDEGMKIDFAT